jgi:hypothetical protein
VLFPGGCPLTAIRICPALRTQADGTPRATDFPLPAKLQLIPSCSDVSSIEDAA